MGFVPKYVRLPMHHCSVEVRTHQFLKLIQFAFVEVWSFAYPLDRSRLSTMWEHYLMTPLTVIHASWQREFRLHYRLTSDRSGV